MFVTSFKGKKGKKKKKEKQKTEYDAYKGKENIQNVTVSNTEINTHKILKSNIKRHISHRRIHSMNEKICTVLSKKSNEVIPLNSFEREVPRLRLTETLGPRSLPRRCSGFPRN